MNERKNAGTLRLEHVDETVTLKGWVHRRRDLGELIFIDLRDHSGIVQIVFNPDYSKEALQIAETLRSEFVIEVHGKVIKRDESTVNPNLQTGEVEVTVSEVTILNKSKNLPFLIHEAQDVSEDLRLKYRYIDLRREDMQRTFKIRHQITQSVRNFLNENEFLEMETPILTKSTPEGARDYLVPSRVHQGEFYALPQSPQLFKQLLMMSGFEKYYQIARCFRDEDLRADRQPEFTQIDIETAFLTSEDVIKLVEQMMQRIMKDVLDIEIKTPFIRLSYNEAMNRFGSDKPDTRFGMELIHVSDIVENMEFKVFSGAVKNGGKVALLNVKGKADQFTRKDIDAGLTEYVATYGAKGLAWIKIAEGDLTGPIAKFFSEEERAQLIERSEAEDGDLLLFVADKSKVVFDSLGALRLKLGKDLGLIDESLYNFLWVVDWPLLEYDEEAKRYTAAHHPFTSPIVEDVEKLKSDPASVRANAYDIVLNGYELGGGSIRINQSELQDTMFEVLGFTKESAREQFGFLLDALEYGAPPHGGVALGLDRIVMLLAGKSNIRDTILFPKTASASDLLTDAPSEVSEAQLEELNIELVNDEE
ncbi:aspartate--tRNA ligase [Pseudogracilibacillus sp. SE30717A]|uniref:aspartate--tRNA ligase n=1 Tax=Pseudogracilibacillus sp. SE30717A TaxID=3098293 RepID=UPI00300E001F